MNKKIVAIKVEILNLANSHNSPFLSPLSENNISITVEANNPNKFNVSLIGNISYINDIGNVQNTPIAPFTVEYKSKPQNNNTSTLTHIEFLYCFSYSSSSFNNCNNITSYF